MIEKWGDLTKPSRAKRIAAKRADKRDVDREELDEKAKARRRDRGCRFPLCGCRRLRFRTEVSHDEHKGRNGLATKRARSKAALMIELCFQRHQDGRISLHKRTLRKRYLTPLKNDGPVAWDVDISALPEYSGTRRGVAVWRELAVEAAIGIWEPFTDWQARTLDELAGMEL